MHVGKLVKICSPRRAWIRAFSVSTCINEHPSKSRRGAPAVAESLDSCVFANKRDAYTTTCIPGEKKKKSCRHDETRAR